MHSLVVKVMFPHVCLDEGFDILVGIPSLDKVIISFLHHGLSQALVLNLFISKLVNLFASSVCVGRICLALCSYFFKTILMSNAHPHLSLLKCLAMTHTHHFG